MQTGVQTARWTDKQMVERTEREKTGIYWQKVHEKVDKGIDELTTDKLKNRQMNGHIFLTLYWNLHVKLNNVDKRTFKINISILAILPGCKPKIPNQLLFHLTYFIKIIWRRKTVDNKEHTNDALYPQRIKFVFNS